MTIITAAAGTWGAVMATDVGVADNDHRLLKRPVDKVVLLWSRYLVGAAGKESVAACFAALERHVADEGKTPPRDVRELLDYGTDFHHQLMEERRYLCTDPRAPITIMVLAFLAEPYRRVYCIHTETDERCRLLLRDVDVTPTADDSWITVPAKSTDWSRDELSYTKPRSVPSFGCDLAAIGEEAERRVRFAIDRAPDKFRGPPRVLIVRPDGALHPSPH